MLFTFFSSHTHTQRDQIKKYITTFLFTLTEQQRSAGEKSLHSPVNASTFQHLCTLSQADTTEPRSARDILQSIKAKITLLQYPIPHLANVDLVLVTKPCLFIMQTFSNFCCSIFEIV